MSTDTDCTLWRAVIAQALEDATKPLPSEHTANYKRRLTEREEARGYFTSITDDFKHVCHLADLDPEAVQEMAQHRIAASDQTPIAKPKLTSGKPVPPRGRVFTFNGETRTLIEWAVHLKVPVSTLANRIRQGWPLEKALVSQMFGPRNRQRRSPSASTG